MGATELKGPVKYKYNDLKAATKNFSAENKLGEGGFGDVYKVNLCSIFQLCLWKEKYASWEISKTRRENTFPFYFQQGTLKNRKVVAVKKLVLGKSSNMEDNFEGEVKLISNVHYRNLVRLLGYCSKSQERILVYEYMANKSLDKSFDGEKRQMFSFANQVRLFKDQ